MYPMYSSNMSLMNPQDTNVMQPNGMYGQPQYQGMNNDAMQQSQMMPNQYPGSNQEMMDKMNAADKAKSEMDAYQMMAKSIQGAGRNMQMPMPSGNTAQIMRDQNQFRFAGTPQQQMANALRNRG